MRRTALPSGVRRVGEDGRPVGRRVPHRPPALPHEGLPRRPVGLPRKRFRPDVTGTRPVRRPHGAAAGVLHAVQPLDGVPHPAGAARRAGRRRLPERRLPGPRRLSLPLLIRRRIHRGQARPAEPGRPAAHRAGTGMEEPADLADAVSVTGRHRRVRAPHLGAPAPRPRITAGSAPRRSGVRTPVPLRSATPGPFRSEGGARAEERAGRCAFRALRPPDSARKRLLSHSERDQARDPGGARHACGRAGDGPRRVGDDPAGRGVPQGGRARRNASAGVRQARTLRGRASVRSWTALTSASVTLRRSVPLGRYPRTRPLVCPVGPRSHEW